MFFARSAEAAHGFDGQKVVEHGSQTGHRVGSWPKIEVAPKDTGQPPKRQLPKFQAGRKAAKALRKREVGVAGKACCPGKMVLNGHGIRPGLGQGGQKSQANERDQKKFTDQHSVYSHRKIVILGQRRGIWQWFFRLGLE